MGRKDWDGEERLGWGGKIGMEREHWDGRIGMVREWSVEKR